MYLIGTILCYPCISELLVSGPIPHKCQKLEFGYVACIVKHPNRNDPWLKTLDQEGRVELEKLKPCR